MKRVVFISIVLIIFSGCSSKILLPYEENALCNCGQGVGYCGSVSDVFAETTKISE